MLMGQRSGPAQATALLSHVTNIIATSLIAYKAWYAHPKLTLIFTEHHHVYRKHRIMLKEHFGAEGAKTQALRVLAIIVESGSAYSVFLVNSVYCV